MPDLNEIKASIRSILLSLGKTATDFEFKKEFHEIEGRHFYEVLKEFNTSFHEFFSKIPDVARIIYHQNQVFLQRVSSETTKHMDQLTINKYSKGYKGKKMVTKSGGLKTSSSTGAIPKYPLNARALPYHSGRYYGQPQHNRRVFQQLPSQRSNHQAQPSFQGHSRDSTYQRTPVDQNKKASTPPFKGHYRDASDQKVPVYQEKKTNPFVSYSKHQQSFANGSKPATQATSSASSASIPQNRFVTQDKGTVTVTVKNPEKVPEAPKVATPVVPKVAAPPQLPPRVFPTASTTPMKKPADDSSSGHSVAKKIVHVNTATTAPPMPVTNEKTKSLTDLMGKLNLKETNEKTTGLAVSEIVSVNIPAEGAASLPENKPAVVPNLMKNQIRSMRLFREALKAINEDQHKSSAKSDVFTSVSRLIVQLPEPIKNEKEQYFEAKILDVSSPSEFIIQFSLDKLENDIGKKMDEFYNQLTDTEKEQLRVRELISDNIVAVKMGNAWRRGQIMSFDSKVAKIRLVDFMTFEAIDVPVQNIFHLHQRFSIESAKSVCAELFGIKPKNGEEWHKNSTTSLIDVIDKTVLVSVRRVRSNGKYSVCIFLENRVRLSDLLIKENFAQIDIESYDQEYCPYSLV